MGEEADIVCGDAWLWELKSRHQKHSLIIARSAETSVWIDEMVDRQRLVAEEISPKMIFRAQRRTLIPAKRGKVAKAQLSRIFGYRMPYKGEWRARWNDYLVATMVLSNSRWSESKFDSLIYRFPRSLLQAYLVLLSFLKNF